MQTDSNTSNSSSQGFRRPIDRSSGRKNFRFLTTAEIAKETPEQVDWIAKPWIARGVITDVTGKAKSAGKTTFLLRAVAAVVNETAFLGEATRKTPVVILTEERPRTFREALNRAGLLGRDDIHVLHWHDTIGTAFHSVVGAADAKCKHVGAGLLIIDTINQFAGFREEDENHSGPVLAIFEPLYEAAARGLAVVIGRHERKSGGRVGDSGRGSTAFVGASDIVLSIRRTEGRPSSCLREVHSLSRLEETPDLLVIELTPDGYVARGSRGAVMAQLARDAILAALPSSSDDAITLKDLMGELPPELSQRTTAQAALAALVKQRVAEQVGRGVKNDPYRFWRPVIGSAGTPSQGRQNETDTDTGEA